MFKILKVLEGSANFYSGHMESKIYNYRSDVFLQHSIHALEVRSKFDVTISHLLPHLEL